MFLAKSWRRLKGGRKQEWYALRATVWDREHKRPRQIHVAYVGITRVITEDKARELAEKASQKLGRKVTLEELRRVRRLRIVPEESKSEPDAKPKPEGEPEPEVLTLKGWKATKWAAKND